VTVSCARSRRSKRLASAGLAMRTSITAISPRPAASGSTRARTPATYAGAVDRSAIVTGAASGIGRAVAQGLVDAGAQVLAVDLEPDADGPGRPFAADLTTRDGNRAAVEAAVDAFGRLDTIVANAGFQHVAPVAEFDEDRWDALLALLLTSPFLLARYGWEALAASGHGRFVAIASAHGLVASPFKSGYVAAKHGVLGLVKTIALEGAAQGITATAVCPGFVRTPLVEGQLAAQAEAHGLPEEQVLEDVILEPHALKRLLEPEEVAAAVLFLLGPGGDAFTGAPLVMDAGWTAR
jgi:3-hydroxybutyrate dehydrogenase